MNSLQKLQKILGLGHYSCGAVYWRVNGILITYWRAYKSNIFAATSGDSVKIYYYGRKKPISTDYFPCVNEMCLDAIQNLKMFRHKL